MITSPKTPRPLDIFLSLNTQKKKKFVEEGQQETAAEEHFSFQPDLSETKKKNKTVASRYLKYTKPTKVETKLTLRSYLNCAAP